MDRWANSASPYCDVVILKRFEPTIRPTDVFLSTFPKCGTTWMQNLLYQLREGGNPQIDCIYNYVPWLEYPIDGVSTEERLEYYARLRDPRIFKLHLCFGECPYWEMAKYITCSRDPRDAAVSLFFHQLYFNRELPQRRKIIEDFDEFIENWLERGKYWEFLNSWWPHRNDPNILWLRFEDLKSELLAQVRRVVDFLKWEVSPIQIERILPLLDFEWMKQNESRFLMDNRDFSGPFFRKGRVDRGASSLSHQQQLAILEAAQKNLPKECFELVVDSI